MRISDWSSDVCSSDLWVVAWAWSLLRSGRCRCRLARARPARVIAVLDCQRLGDALQGLALGAHAEEDLDDPAGNHQCRTDEVADRDLCDVTAVGSVDRKSTRLNSSH